MTRRAASALRASPLLLLAACVPAAPPYGGPVAPQPLDPMAFFTGDSHGTGMAKILLSGAAPLKVTSRGAQGADGTLTLDQDIVIGTKTPRHRRWVMRADGPGRWTGTLTEASGPVTLTREGAGIAIAYRMANGASVAQLLLPVDARTVANRMTIRKWGVPVAMLTETIVKD